MESIKNSDAHTCATHLYGGLACCNERVLCSLVLGRLAVLVARGFATMNLVQHFPVPFHKVLVRELPSVWIDLSEAIGVELTHKAGEVVVLEVLRQKVASKLGRLPNHKTGTIKAPGHDRVCARLVHQVVPAIGDSGIHPSVREPNAEKATPGVSWYVITSTLVRKTISSLETNAVRA